MNENYIAYEKEIKYYFINYFHLEGYFTDY